MAEHFEHTRLPTGIELAWDSVGEGEPVLLVMGLASQMVMWPDDFCHQLAGRGFRVIRFDNRDVGESTAMKEAGAISLPRLLAALAGRGRDSAPYHLWDMADDAFGLLDSMGIERCHVVGASMGGMIAQQMAIQDSSRVASLTSIMSTTGSRRVGMPSPAAIKMLLTPTKPTEDAMVERFVAFFQAVGSPAYPADVDELAAMARRSFARGVAGDGFGRQLMAVLASGNRTEGLKGLSIPALVIHGEADPLVSVSGGEATAAAIPGATLMRVPGMGHDIPRALWPRFIDGIEATARRATP